MLVAAGSEWNFAYVMPQEEDQPVRPAASNALQMGWKDSPGFLCSASETTRDVTEELSGFNSRQYCLLMHKFEHLIKKPTQESPADPDVTPCVAIKVFVDDFIALCQDVPQIDQLT